MRSHHLPKFLATGLVLIAGLLSLTRESHAIPAFSRQYGTSCTTCHLDFPKLNDFGKAFKDAGFKFPKDDESFIKTPPVLLGAPAQKDVWPHSVWPGQIPGMPPIGLRMNNFFQFTSSARKNFDALATPGTVPSYIPATDFETGFFSIFTAGNFGSDIAFWVDDDISVAGSNGSGGLGDGYLKFINIGRFLKLPKDSLSLRAGQFELDLPFTQARNINLSPYDIYAEGNIGAINSMVPLQQNVANAFTFAGAARGFELSGGHQYGGYHYSVAIINQNTSGASPNVSPYVPSATGGANGGVGFFSDSSLKNVYARFSYRFNLERDKESRNAVQAAGNMGPRDHTYLNLGTFYLHGNSLQRVWGALGDGSATLLSAREPYYRAGGDFSLNYRTFDLFGVYMVARDKNLLPVDASGALIPLPLSSTSPPPVGFISSVPAKFRGGFVEADYLVLPWMMLIGRWDGVNSSADRINGLALATGTPYFGPLNSTRNRFTPGMQFLIHPNIKASFEYQFRPQQFAQVTGDGIQTALRGLDPFRVNTFLTALEFVY
ncbi:MAG: hypothetical protein ABSH47_25775 [Bryobacteraceae bacterium]